MVQGLYLLQSIQTQEDVGVRWNWTADLGVRAENVIADLLYRVTNQLQLIIIIIIIKVLRREI